MLACLSSLVVATAWRAYAGERTFIAGTAVSFALLCAVATAPFYAQLRAGEPPPAAEYSELVPLAEQVMQHVAPGDTLYVYPDDEGLSNLYYLTGTLPPKPWIFTYPWYMMDWVRGGIMSHLREQPPDWIVYFPER